VLSAQRLFAAARPEPFVSEIECLVICRDVAEVD